MVSLSNHAPAPPLFRRSCAGRKVNSHFKCPRLNTWVMKTSAGVRYPRHFRGVLLYRCRAAVNSSSSKAARLVERGRGRRRRPMAFSTPPFCQGE